MGLTLGEIAQRYGLEVRGDSAVVIDGVCTLAPGRPGAISFLANSKYKSQLAGTAAGAVIVGARDAAGLTTPGLVAKDPQLAYARVAALFDPSRAFVPGVHPGAVVAASATIGAGVHIGPHAVIGEGVSIGEGTYVGPACVIGANARIGAGSRLIAQVHLGDRVRIGQRCTIQAGAVVGSRGFGNVMGPNGWEEIPQLGSVEIGDDCEIGANTCIDRGAIDDTVIGRNVRLDNLIQIGHNVRIGDHTAIAACTGIAGSTRVGSRCMIGGAAGIGGHLEIADGVVILGRAMVTHSLTEKGIYGSGLPVAPAREWRRTVGRIRRLDRLEKRVKQVEGKLDIDSGSDGDDDQDAVRDP